MQLFTNEIFLAVVFTTLLVLLLVVGIVLTFFISGRQRARQRMELAESKLTFERELRKVETEVGEQMMRQFAQELHDNIGQLLTSTHIQLQNKTLDHPDLKQVLQPVEIYLDEVSRQLRLLSRTLNPDYLDNNGLVSAMQTEVERLKDLKRLTVQWQKPEGVTGLDKNQELMVFRIFQEIIQNALKHSGAKNLIIDMRLDTEFELEVRDDGRGFDKNAVLDSAKASGLHNIIKRAGLAGIYCHIKTEPGKGCLFVLKKVSILG